MRQKKGGLGEEKSVIYCELKVKALKEGKDVR